MMTHANANSADPVAAALAIAKNARRKTERPEARPGMAGVIALAAGVLLSLSAIGAMALSPAAVPAWCAAHGGCPTAPTFAHTT
ncbi:MAG: hypothetical protein M3154_08065 [Candidatus Eremiobacteraeota bacterium]|nr:hypothetical protein [Candidatus Eremiobacteraeota bacterium]